MCTKNHNHMTYGPFLPFCPTSNLQNQNFEKMKKSPGDITILRMCPVNDNHMMYGPEICSTMDIIFYHFGPFSALLPLE